jgi:hypothetical protein
MPLPFIIAGIGALASGIAAGGAAAGAIATGAAVGAGALGAGAIAAGIAGAGASAGAVAGVAGLTGLAASVGGVTGTTLAGLSASSLAAGITAAATGTAGPAVLSTLGTVGAAINSALATTGMSAALGAAKVSKIHGIVTVALLAKVYNDKKKTNGLAANNAELAKTLEEFTAGKHNTEITAALNDSSFRESIECLTKDDDFMQMLTNKAIQQAA